jgi:hypothetical protein
MVLVVGGSGRKAGKTSVITALIRAFPSARWVALKVTPHHPVSGWKLEQAKAGEGDSGRYLAAGAAESWYLRCTAETLRDAMPAVRDLIDRAPNTIIESNTILDYLAPDLYIGVAGAAGAEFKESFGRHGKKAKAIVVTGEDSGAPVFISQELLRLVESRLAQAAGNATRSENTSSSD